MELWAACFLLNILHCSKYLMFIACFLYTCILSSFHALIYGKYWVDQKVHLGFQTFGQSNITIILLLLTQPLVGTLLLSPGSWCAQGFVCALLESVSQVLWKLCNQIPLASKVKFCGGSYLLSSSMVGLMATSSKRAYATHCVSQVATPTAPVAVAGHCWPMPP